MNVFQNLPKSFSKFLMKAVKNFLKTFTKIHESFHNFYESFLKFFEAFKEVCFIVPKNKRFSNALREVLSSFHIFSISPNPY